MSSRKSQSPVRKFLQGFGWTATGVALAGASVAGITGALNPDTEPAGAKPATSNTLELPTADTRSDIKMVPPADEGPVPPEVTSGTLAWTIKNPEITVSDNITAPTKLGIGVLRRGPKAFVVINPPATASVKEYSVVSAGLFFKNGKGVPGTDSFNPGELNIPSGMNPGDYILKLTVEHDAGGEGYLHDIEKPLTIGPGKEIVNRPVNALAGAPRLIIKAAPNGFSGIVGEATIEGGGKVTGLGQAGPAARELHTFSTKDGYGFSSDAPRTEVIFVEATVADQSGNTVVESAELTTAMVSPTQATNRGRGLE